MPTTRAKKKQEQKSYKCFCCGLETSTSIAQTFRKSKSMLYKQNDQQLPICRNCMVSYYEQISRDVGHNPYASIERICQMYDLYYDEDIVKLAVDAKSELSLIEVYFSKSGLAQFQRRGRTYRDTVRRRNEIGEKNVIIEEDEDTVTVKQKKRKRQDFVTEDMREFWGRAYEDEKDVLMLQDHFNDLNRIAESCGYNLDVDLSRQLKVKRLCEINLRMQKEIIGDGKSISQLSSEYNKLFKETGLDQENELDMNSASFGQWLRDITKYTPAEIYDDPNMYKDFFGGDEYIERHIERPMRNLFTGSKVKDYEQNIGEGE